MKYILYSSVQTLPVATCSDIFKLIRFVESELQVEQDREFLVVSAIGFIYRCNFNNGTRKPTVYRISFDGTNLRDLDKE